MDKNTNVPLVSMKNISKNFAGVRALDDVSIDILAGEVHGLLGANGAGKSTLIKILAGAYHPNSGEILFEGEHVVIHNPHDSAKLGMGFIHQELNLVENFNVIENITLGLNKVTNFGLIEWKSTSKKVNDVLNQVEFSFPLTTPIKQLSVADKWMVAIARALYQDAKLLAMDEPTASLSETEVQILFKVIRNLRNQGIGIIYVSHRLDEVREICDRITVFKDGKFVLSQPSYQLSKNEIINAIVGKDLQIVENQIHHNTKETILKVIDIYDDSMVKGVSFDLHRGEVLGITGLVGSGRTELAKLIFGANPKKKGVIFYKGKSYEPKNPGDAVKLGLAYIPEERRTEGLIGGKSVSFNINLPFLEALRISNWLPLLSQKEAKKITLEIIRKLQIKTAGTEAGIMSLSGGNQQKVVIGKWLTRQPTLFIMDEPTRGVDVGARAEIYKIIREMSDEGKSFIVISSDIEELPGLCDRVIVMVRGKISGQLVNEQITKDALLWLSYADVK